MSSSRRPARLASAPRGTLAVALGVVLGVGLLAGCGSDAEPGSAASSPSASASASSSASASESASESAGESATPAPEGTVVSLRIEGGAVRPEGSVVRVAVGEPVTLQIRSDVADELHVHSTPEQEIAFEAGRSEHRLVIDRPGVVDVESHELGLVLVRLEVR